MAEYTTEKMVELAEFIVETMDQEQLVALSYQYIIEGFEVNEEGFHEDWHTYFGLDEEDAKSTTDSGPNLRVFRGETEGE